MSTIKQHSSFQIKTIQLKKFDFEQTGKLKKKIGINLAQGIGATAKKESESQYFIQLNVDLSSMQGDVKVFYIHSVIVSIIEVSDNFDKSLLNNMVAIMYSYLRPMVAQMTVMAKLPPLDLPPVSFEEFKVKMLDDKQSSTAESNQND